jgi:hypothetical protein
MTTPAPSPSPLIATLARFRSQVDKRDRAAIKQLATAYSKIFKRLQAELELEARRIFDGNTSVSRVYVAKRLSDLMDSVEAELAKYSNVLESTIDTATDDALTLGSKHALELMRAATGRDGLVGINFGAMNPAQVNTIIGFLSPSSPLFKRIGQLGRFHAPIIRDQLVEAIALGFNPYKTAGNIAPYLADIAQKFQIAMARPFADAVRMARTAQLWAYRESSRANYQANSDVVSGWTWFTQLDGVACGACISLHGTVHPLDEPLEGHYHCRCSPVPVVLGNPLVQEGAGLEWFSQQDEATQRGILGPGAFDAFQAGKFEFDQLHRATPDETYGQMQTVTPLKDLIGSEG